MNRDRLRVALPPRAGCGWRARSSSRAALASTCSLLSARFAISDDSARMEGVGARPRADGVRTSIQAPSVPAAHAANGATDAFPFLQMRTDIDSRTRPIHRASKKGRQPIEVALLAGPTSHRRPSTAVATEGWPPTRRERSAYRPVKILGGEETRRIHVTRHGECHVQALSRFEPGLRQEASSGCSQLRSNRH